MAQTTSPIHAYLLAQYGPLLTLEHLAAILHSSPNGLRMALARRRHPLAVALAGARRRLGRRVMFEAGRVAHAIDTAGTTEHGAARDRASIPAASEVA